MSQTIVSGSGSEGHRPTRAKRKTPGAMGPGTPGAMGKLVCPCSSETGTGKLALAHATHKSTCDGALAPQRRVVRTAGFQPARSAITTLSRRLQPARNTRRQGSYDMDHRSRCEKGFSHQWSGPSWVTAFVTELVLASP